MSEHLVENEHRVTPLELFFDLVFVFGFTQVTTLLHEDPTWHGLARGLLALVVLWWAWASFAWLTNLFDANAGVIVTTTLVATGAMFLASLAVPDAFAQHRFLFAFSFVVVIAMFVVLFARATRGEAALLAAVIRALRWTLIGALLIVVAAFTGATARPWLWLAAVFVGFVGPGLTDMSGWRVHPAHFAERHGLIVIIAIGESLVGIGLAARSTTLDASVVAAVVLGLLVAASLWLAYFDFFAVTMQRLLAERGGEERATLARDVYTYLHVLMIVGIVLFAFGMRTTITHVHATLGTVPALGLCFGSALYLAGYVALRWRVDRSVGAGRTTAAVCFALVFPLALHVPALAAIAVCAAVWIVLHAYELMWWRTERAERRAASASA